MDGANTCAEACHALTAPSLASTLALTPSPAGAGPANKRAEARVTMRTHMFRGAYEPPKNPQHQEFYEFLKNSQVLEKFSDSLSALRLAQAALDQVRRLRRHVQRLVRADGRHGNLLL